MKIEWMGRVQQTHNKASIPPQKTIRHSETFFSSLKDAAANGRCASAGRPVRSMLKYSHYYSLSAVNSVLFLQRIHNKKDMKESFMISGFTLLLLPTNFFSSFPISLFLSQPTIKSVSFSLFICHDTVCV